MEGAHDWAHVRRQLQVRTVCLYGARAASLQLSRKVPRGRDDEAQLIADIIDVADRPNAALNKSFE